MAEKKAEDLNLEFELVTDTYNVPSQIRRRSPGADVSRTGYTETNVNGTTEIHKLLGGHVADQFQLKFGTNEAKGLVAAYAATEGEPGAVTVKRSKNRKVISFHLGHIFDKFPALRPAGELFCTLKLSTDKTGTPCIIINLRGTAVRKGRSTEPATQAAAAQQTNPT